jgi:hypothetical protein
LCTKLSKFQVLGKRNHTISLYKNNQNFNKQQQQQQLHHQQQLLPTITSTTKNYYQQQHQHQLQQLLTTTSYLNNNTLSRATTFLLSLLETTMKFCCWNAAVVALAICGGNVKDCNVWSFIIPSPAYVRNDAQRQRSRVRVPQPIDALFRNNKRSFRIQSSPSDDSDSSSNPKSRDDHNMENTEDIVVYSDCDEDGECDIDWDAMPGFVDTDEEENIHSDESSHSDESNGDDLMNASADQLRTRFEMQWKMTEQTEECDVYQPVSCGGNVCEACQGKGVCTCRFCRGTGFIYMKLPSSVSSVSTSIPPPSRGEQLRRQYEESIYGGTLNALLQEEPSSVFSACNICEQKGIETCKNCRGSGWIADWTSINIHSSLKP